MLLYLRNGRAQLWVIRQKDFHQLPSISFQIFWQIQFSTPTFFHYGLRIARFMLVLKRCEATNNFAQQYPYAPYISFVCVAGIQHYFWGAVARCSAVRVGLVLVYVLNVFREAEIYEFYMAILIK